MVEITKKEQERGNIKSSIDARYLIAGAFATGFGLLVFEKFLLPATGLEDNSLEEVLEVLKNNFFLNIKE